MTGTGGQQGDVEAAMARHPSGEGPTGVLLTAVDRCDRCGAAAGYRVIVPPFDPDAWVGFDEPDGPRKVEPYTLDFCVHHWRKHFPVMEGWVVIGGNPQVIGAYS
ncbi:DUF7455 domain-containing protein [Streptomyces sp. S1]|uniref:DUF7455 domain-containing protein n=1 Tax=Streptomyces sp. S1 TaxID=718288 RepID=UPI003D75F311